MMNNPSGIKVVLLVVIATVIGGLLLAQEAEKTAPKAAEKSGKTSAAQEETAAAKETTEPAAADEPGTEEKAAEAEPGEPATDPKAAVSPQAAKPIATPPTPKSFKSRKVRRQGVIASITIFVLAVFVGFLAITKIPPTLHTPLMSGSNAISGITLVGAVIVAATMSFSGFVGFLAVTLATINAVGGFLVTHRMLAMFKKR